MISRRHLLAASAAAASVCALRPTFAQLAASTDFITKAIPSSQERLPVIGMGSSRTFDKALDNDTRLRLGQVLSVFFEHGGTLIDSSPMYGEAESVLGELLAAAPARDQVFAASKVWTDGQQQGIEQMQRSLQRMRVARFDLMQIHNLRDWSNHLQTLKAWKAEGKIRHLGVTTSHGRNHRELEGLLRDHPFDFVQLSYSIANRDVEQRLLPLAMEHGIAVIANRPFERGQLFAQVRGKPLLPWASEHGIHSWGQFFLKYVVSHPAITCTIPATAKPKHMRDNMGALLGQLPEAALRRDMQRHMAQL